MNRNSFIWSDASEPHLGRRKRILQEFPEIRNLFGIDKWLKYKSLLVVAIHLTTVFFLPENVWVYIALLFFFGATFAHVLFLAIHEITHDLAFKKTVFNNILAIVVNFPLVFPFAIAFKIYHAKHHWQQGTDGVDTDIPSAFEANTFKGYIGKLIWLSTQIFFYAIRPLVVHPIKLDKWQIINSVSQITFVLILYFFVGWEGILYLILSLILAGGLHPIAGHFIAEHYVMKEDQETYSYYGPLNAITFNVGYHNEHHDFPAVPGSRLPDVRKIASNHYDNLYAHKSWTALLFKFVFNKSISLNSRIKRSN